MSTHITATIYDVEEYRRRKALRDCGRDSRRQEFLWLPPGSAVALVAVFHPAQSSGQVRPSKVVRCRYSG